MHIRFLACVALLLTACTEQVSHSHHPPFQPSSQLITAYQPRSFVANNGGLEQDEHCKTPIVAPMKATDLVNRVEVTMPGQVLRSTPGGSSTMSGGTLTIHGPTVTLTFLEGAASVDFRAVGFHAQNGTGSIAKGASANQLEPLMLSIEALQAPPGGQSLGRLRFWTYQGLKPGTSDLDPAQYDERGKPDPGMKDVPAYLGIGMARASTSAPPVTLARSVRITVLNPGKIPPGGWSLSGISYSKSAGNRTCWNAGTGWRLISDPNEQQPQQPRPFTHVLRTEAFESHMGHTVGRYWEFNRYGADGQGTADDPSTLQGSNLQGELHPPIIQLRDIESHCDFHGQGDVPGMYHWSHFHIQGFHETEDNNPSDPDLQLQGFGPPEGPGLYAQYCAPGAPANYYRDELHVCEAYKLCYEAAAVSRDPSDALMGLGHTYCGATCIQTMQAERDACARPPSTDDERNFFYSLNNGRTWRRVNWMKDRYHGGYPGSWHYYHAHPYNDSDGMLGMDDYYTMPGYDPDLSFGFDWDQDGVNESSSGDPLVDDQYDPQFSGGVDLETGLIRSPAMRFRFQFDENARPLPGTTPSIPGWSAQAGCVDVNGDGHCAGWRIDDIALDYDEECPSSSKFYDSLEEQNPGSYEVWPESEVAAVCNPTKAKINSLLLLGKECEAVQPSPRDALIYDAMMRRVTKMEMEGTHH